MSRTGIRYEDVSHAITLLQSQQKNPTVDHIREVLGTGSKSTISRYLREWRASQEVGQDESSRLPTELISMIQGLWDAIHQKAEARMDENAAEAEQKITEVQAQLEMALQNETGLHAQIQRLEKSVDRKVEEIQLLKVQIQNKEQENIRLNERMKALESRQVEYQSENERLHVWLKQAQGNIEHQQQLVEKMREDHMHQLEKQREFYDGRLEKTMNELNALKHEKIKIDVELTQATRASEVLQTQYTKTSTAFDVLQSEHQLLKHTNQHTISDNKTLIEKNRSQASELALQARELLSLEVKYQNERESTTKLEKALALQEEKLERMREALHDKEGKGGKKVTQD